MSQNTEDGRVTRLEHETMAFAFLLLPVCQWTGWSCWPPVHTILTSKQNCMCKEERSSCLFASVLTVNKVLHLQMSSGLCKPCTHR